MLLEFVYKIQYFIFLQFFLFCFGVVGFFVFTPFFAFDLLVSLGSSFQACEKNMSALNRDKSYLSIECTSEDQT